MMALIFYGNPFWSNSKLQVTPEVSQKDSSPGQGTVLAHNCVARDNREEFKLLLRPLVSGSNTGTPELYPTAEAHLNFFTTFFLSFSYFTQQPTEPAGREL